MKKIGFLDLVIVILVCLLIFSSIIEIDENDYKTAYSYPSVRLKEKDYVNTYCSGQIEYMLPDKTRIDCLTEEYAIEFDFAKKWAESIGQSLYYAKKTGKKPAVAIILKKESDKKYVEHIKDIGLDITVFEICSSDYKGSDVSMCLDRQLPYTNQFD